MSFISAIRSYLTPAKIYRNDKVLVRKKLQKDGSMLISAFNHNGTLVKTIRKESFDVLQYETFAGNVLTYGHKTTVQNFINGSETKIKKYTKRFEKAIYNALSRDEKIVDKGGSIHYFDKVTRKGETLSGTSFHLAEYPQKRNGVITDFNDAGIPIRARRVL